MTDRSSRHRDGRRYRRALRGREVELYQPREIPPTTGGAAHPVAGDDRLDLLAQRYLSDPYQYWRIADANPSAAPEDLLEAGRAIVIPDPD